MRALFVLAACCALVAGCDRRVGAGMPAPSNSNDDSTATTAAVDADNTAVNARDRAGTIPTPLDQGQGQDDINITATIRKRVVELPLSLNAHNVKIITQAGKVTLRGPVETEQEKQQIEGIASQVAGAENVDNMLEVELD